MIFEYDNYSETDYTQTKKLPKISKDEAKKLAGGYIKGIDPELPLQLKYNKNTQGGPMDTSCPLTYDNGAYRKQHLY